MAASLRLSELTKIYGTTRAVDRLSLSIAPGNMVALLGPRGYGKTTTLRMIAGLIEPNAGDIFIDDIRITRVPVHRRNIGMLFQNYALFPHMTVAENIAFGLETRGVKGSAAAERVQGALQLVQLSGYGDRLPSQLSGGQQQRVALARALVVEPMLLLLDEPLGALDKSLRESMQTELRGLQQRLGVTTVFVTHDQDEALTMADRIVICATAGSSRSAPRPRSISGRYRASSPISSARRISFAAGSSASSTAPASSSCRTARLSPCHHRGRSAAR